ncbi:MAG: MerR family transcriptional regulator [Chloroflexi bacterium]|jgi:DNA-binding transcriptional MerR regulator|nr:MerR family transcriptional regulator [Chloroflexota bacterium]BCY16842.1 hypothetical protein hrd7_06910 [Leptolinea sp. HRD-7]
MQEEQYQISELANITGHTVRTIRYYMDEGLLPQPVIQGRYAYFGDSYIPRLKLIQRLKDAYLPLREIRRILDSLNDEQIKDYAEKDDLSELGVSALIPPATLGAVGYIESVLKNQNRERIRESQNRQSFLSSKSNAVTNDSGRSSNRLEKEGTQWRRIELRKGIELHIDERTMSMEGDKLLSIIEHFKRVLRSEL